MSFQQYGRYRTSDLNKVRAPDTLFASQINEDPLPLDQRYPSRLIARDRPGSLQTTWGNRMIRTR
jgi:DMSO/TMAO reductase YedYZ molybdopterin-dependent catalytic subunit